MEGATCQLLQQQPIDIFGGIIYQPHTHLEALGGKVELVPTGAHVCFPTWGLCIMVLGEGNPSSLILGTPRQTPHKCKIQQQKKIQTYWWILLRLPGCAQLWYNNQTEEAEWLSPGRTPTFSASQDAWRKGGTGRRPPECRSEDDDLIA